MKCKSSSGRKNSKKTERAKSGKSTFKIILQIVYVVVQSDFLTSMLINMSFVITVKFSFYKLLNLKDLL